MDHNAHLFRAHAERNRAAGMDHDDVDYLMEAVNATPDNFVWKTEDGRRIPIRQMGAYHLGNAVDYMQRQLLHIDGQIATAASAMAAKPEDADEMIEGLRTLVATQKLATDTSIRLQQEQARRLKEVTRKAKARGGTVRETITGDTVIENVEGKPDGNA